MANLKIAATSMGTVVLLLLTLPLIKTTAMGITSSFPAVWWFFEPPYIYLVVNVIVLAIAASSKLHLNPSPQMIVVPSPASEELHDAGGEFDFDDRELKEEVVTVTGEDSSSSRVVMEVVDSVVEEDKFVISPREIVVLPDDEEEEPLVSSTLEHRKAAISTIRGDQGLTSTMKQHDTLDDAWKAITEGQQPRQQPKEKDTWREYGRQMQDSEQKMIKSETFKDRGSRNYTARKEPSLSQDELNRRVEAFIRKVNEEMRLQREESLNQYKEMISRGA